MSKFSLKSVHKLYKNLVCLSTHVGDDAQVHNAQCLSTLAMVVFNIVEERPGLHQAA